MKKALYFDILNYHPDNLKRIGEHFDLVCFPNPSMVPGDVLPTVSVVFAPLGYFFGREFIDAAGNLEVIATNTTGTPHIDTVYARQKGIRVVSLAGQTRFLGKITPTAELTFGLIIALTRNIPAAFQSVKEGRWSRWDFGGPAMLSSMSLGIVGLGRLGKMVARYGASFGMSVSFYDPYVTTAYSKKLRRVHSLEDLVASSDIVTLHIPMEEKNRHIFNRAVFSKFKEKSYFVNTSRGEIVDSAALIESLKNGRLTGAALDVLDGEFDPEFGKRVLEHPLVEYARKNTNLILTPHIAGSTYDAWFLTQKYTIEMALKYISKESSRRSTT
jgi:phosphoglycerate dehydrogenase-like enzyme